MNRKIGIPTNARPKPENHNGIHDRKRTKKAASNPARKHRCRKKRTALSPEMPRPISFSLNDVLQNREMPKLIRLNNYGSQIGIPRKPKTKTQKTTTQFTT